MLVSPISLYIDLEPGKSVELEAVARASLEFAAGLREAAFLFDPSFEFRIELERGDEGSLWLKAFIRWVRGQGYPQPTMKAITFAAASWFMVQTGTYTYEKLLDHFLKSDDPEIVRLAPEQLEEIARRASRVIDAKEPGKHFQGVYRELDRDPAVRGVGVSEGHAAPPSVIVPRSEFAARSSAPPIAVSAGARRTREERGDFVIIRPVLKAGGGRWRLRGPGGEFSATIADDIFYNDILRGNAPVPLAAEIHMTADLEVQEERMEEGAWRVLGYRITKVHAITRQPMQAQLFPPRRDRQ
ncbi:MAG: hypothetical protein EON56_02600 [Alphaproteobacteria bacterium]|nr:MAG: hypothetical protein EON56_02600 [Alphaproteobacteria bacterium]